MKYVDIGYSVCLASLFLYAVSLVARRRRLTRAAALVEPVPPAPTPPAGPAPDPHR